MTTRPPLPASCLLRVLVPCVAIALLAPETPAQEFVWSHTPSQPPFNRGLGHALLALPDLDGDGLADLAVADPLSSLGGEVQLRSSATGALLRTITGPGVAIELGAALATVPDRDGDGRDDLAIGAPGANAGAGEVRIHSTATGALLATIGPGAPGARLGTALARTGDANGDGVDDLLAGAPRAAGGTGEVWRLSGATLAPIGIVHGVFAAEFGGVLAAADDLDGDGVGDWLAGLPKQSPASASGAGEIRAHSGATGGQHWSVPHPTPGARLGAAALGFDDLDGDGVGDVLVGAPGTTLHDVGFVYALSGASGALLFGSTSPTGFFTFGNGSRFGESVDRVGDWDGDGTADFVAGAPGVYDCAFIFCSSLTGAAHVVSGASGAVLATLQGVAGDVDTGRSVAAVSDLDGDGRLEIAVGNDSGSVLGKQPGGLAMFHGGDGVKLWSAAGTPANGPASTQVVSLGDVDGDGVSDAVFAQQVPDATAASVLQVVRALSGRDGSPLWESVAFSVASYSESYLLPLPDVDGDGVGELQVVPSTYEFDFGGDPPVVLSGRTGSLLATLPEGVSHVFGDLDQDGSPDFAVADPFENVGGIEAAGLVRVRSGLGGPVLWSLSGSTSYELLGWGLAASGDLSGDGAPDLILVRSPLIGGAREARVEARVGSTGALLWSTVVASAVGDPIPFFALDPIVSIPDVDGDGIDDVVAVLSQWNGTTPWQSILRLSGATGAIGLSIALPGSIAGSFGPFTSVGDADGDGARDLARVLYGTPGVLELYSSVSGLLLFSVPAAATAGAGLSVPVREIGDVDLDGTSDLVLGEFSSGTLGGVYSPVGRLVVRSGRTGAWIETVETGVPWDGFGATIAPAGDLDGDGLADLFAGPGTVRAVSLRPKGLSFFGTGTPSCLGAATLTASSPLQSNLPGFEFRADHAPPLALGVLVLSEFGDPAGSDPFGLGVLLHVDLLASSWASAHDLVSDANGFARAPIPLPDMSPYAGMSATAQAIWYWPAAGAGACGAAPYGLSTSRGLVLTVQ